MSSDEVQTDMAAVREGPVWIPSNASGRPRVHLDDSCKGIKQAKNPRKVEDPSVLGSAILSPTNVCVLCAGQRPNNGAYDAAHPAQLVRMDPAEAGLSPLKCGECRKQIDGHPCEHCGWSPDGGDDAE